MSACTRVHLKCQHKMLMEVCSFDLLIISSQLYCAIHQTYGTASLKGSYWPHICRLQEFSSVNALCFLISFLSKYIRLQN